MSWEVILDDDFSAWLDGLADFEADEILTNAGVLAEYGPNLGRTRVDSVKGSTYSNMKELRVQIAGDPWRILFCL